MEENRHETIQRLEDWLDERKIKRAEFLKQIDVSSQRYNNWRERGIPVRHMDEVAKQAGLSYEYLRYGKGHRVTAGTVEMTVGEPIAAYSMDELGKDRIAVKPLIPLISFVQAGQFCECIDLMEPGDAEDWLPLPKGASASTYALRVKGSSMTNPLPNGHNYPEGIIIFVDPEQEVLPGHRGIFKTPDTNEATFKELVSDNGKLYLRPLNPQFSMVEVDKNMTTCGRVIGSYLPE